MFQTNFIFQTKKYMLSAATIFLLLVSMILTACGGAGDEKKDTAQKDKPIEITDVTGQKVTLKKPAERVLLQWSGSGGAFITMSAIMGKDVPNVIAGIVRHSWSIAPICGTALRRIFLHWKRFLPSDQ